MKSRIQLGDSLARAKLAGELVCEHQNSDLHTRQLSLTLIKHQASTIQFLRSTLLDLQISARQWRKP